VLFVQDGFQEGSMTKKQGQKTYFSVAPRKRDASLSTFVDYALPSGDRARVMSKRVFEGALDSADRRLRELAEERRKREAVG
jgi:hypothetical protein